METQNENNNNLKNIQNNNMSEDKRIKSAFEEQIEKLIVFANSQKTNRWFHTESLLNQFLTKMLVYSQNIPDLSLDDNMKSYLAFHLFQISQTVTYGLRDGSSIYKGIMITIGKIRSMTEDELLDPDRTRKHIETRIRENLKSTDYRDKVSLVQKGLDEQVTPFRLGVLIHIHKLKIVLNDYNQVRETLDSKHSHQDSDVNVWIEGKSYSRNGVKSTIEMHTKRVEILSRMQNEEKISEGEHALLMKSSALKKDPQIAKYPKVFTPPNPEKIFEILLKYINDDEFKDSKFPNTKKELEIFLMKMKFYCQKLPDLTIEEMKNYLDHHLFFMAQSIPAHSRDTDPLYHLTMGVIEKIRLYAEEKYEETLPAPDKRRRSIEERMGPNMFSPAYKKGVLEFQNKLDLLVGVLKVEIVKSDGNKNSKSSADNKKMSAHKGNSMPKFVFWQFPTFTQCVEKFIDHVNNLKNNDNENNTELLDQFLTRMLVYGQNVPGLVMKNMRDYFDFHLYNIAQKIPQDKREDDACYNAIMVIMESIRFDIEEIRGNLPNKAERRENVETRMETKMANSDYQQGIALKQNELDGKLLPSKLTLLTHCHRLKTILDEDIAITKQSNFTFIAPEAPIPGKNCSKQGLENAIEAHKMRLEILGRMSEEKNITQDELELLKQLEIFANDPVISEYNHINNSIELTS